MPICGCQAEIAELARRDGVDLVPAPRYPWLCERGHLALDPQNSLVRSLEEIYLALGGDLAILASGRLNPLRNDLPRGQRHLCGSRRDAALHLVPLGDARRLPH